MLDSGKPGFRFAELNVHKPEVTGYNSMARSDSFFIRATLDCNNTNDYQQTAIDLGAYVDALGKSVLRIHNIAVTFSDSSGRTSEVTSSGSAPFNGAAAQFQLLTQSQTDIVLPSLSLIHI